MKRGDNAQQESDANAITDYSNRLDTARTQISVYEGTIEVYSNNLAESQSASFTFSNQLLQAQSTLALEAQQITNLNQQFAEAESKNQTLQTTSGQIIADLTNQVGSLTTQNALTETNLAQANHDYSLLENRLRRDVAERVVLERKFRNLNQLQAQIQDLKQNPFEEISAESIYAGLDVEVKSNQFHVISPN
jgi:chromosome segregation ATPase